MIAAKHRKMVHRRARVSSTPFSVSKSAIQTFKGGRGAEAPVCPCISWFTLSQINETKLLDMIIESINTPNIRSTWTYLFIGMHDIVHIPHTKHRQVAISYNKIKYLRPYGVLVMWITIDTNQTKLLQT
jgi:hypothetical protein